MFKLRIYRSDGAHMLVCTIGQAKPQQSDLMNIADDLNMFFASQRLSFVARIHESK